MKIIASISLLVCGVLHAQFPSWEVADREAIVSVRGMFLIGHDTSASDGIRLIKGADGVLPHHWGLFIRCDRISSSAPGKPFFFGVDFVPTLSAGDAQAGPFAKADTPVKGPLSLKYRGLFAEGKVGDLAVYQATWEDCAGKKADFTSFTV